MRTFELNDFYRNKKIKFCHKKTLTTFVITFDDDTELELVADLHYAFNNQPSPYLKIFTKQDMKELL